MNPQRSNKTREGALSTILVVFLLVLSLVMMLMWAIRCRNRDASCREHLEAIYHVFEIYEIESGVLPALAFYPDDPLGDENSLRVFVEKQGLNGECCLCPSSPRSVLDTGLTYIWNVELNGKKLQGGEAPQWMLTEIHALSESVPAPHCGRYHVLYTDGTVESVSELPQDLVAASP